MSHDPLLSVNDLRVEFQSSEGTVYAVNGVSFHVNKGEILGVVGESGCGKSVSMMSILKLIPSPPGRVTSGTAIFDGKNLLEQSDRQMSNIRGNDIGVIFQDPIVSFNPVYTIGNQLIEPLMTHQHLSVSDARDKVCEMLELVGITNPRARLKSYPHQFSGGMRQRAMIAMSLICNPKLLIADEPTTALDVTIEAQIVDLVKELQKEMGMSIIWITHDLGLMAGMAQRLAVMYAGFIVEYAPIKDIYKNPLHPYTIGLLGSLPRINETGYRRLDSIAGMPPILRSYPTSCPFSNRCSQAMEQCYKANPPLIRANGDHHVACWRYDGGTHG